MAHKIVLEFSGVDIDAYWRVNDALGIDIEQSENMPDGMTAHAAGMSDEGTLVVTEIWETREQQAAFMDDRLGAALGEVGVPPPARVTWIDLVSDRRL